MKEDTLYDSDDQKVWATCDYLRKIREIKSTKSTDSIRCEKCPALEYHEEYDIQTVRGCRLLAQEMINVVETGNPWRKTKEELRDDRFTAY
jgi:hypothetical protein